MRRNQVKSSKDGGAEKKPKGGLSFGFFLFVVGVVASSMLLMVMLQQFALKSDLSARKTQTRINTELTKQKSLRLQLAKLMSPGRIEKMAKDDLGMEEQAGVIYLKYTKDAQGNLACTSTYESLEPTPPPAGDSTAEADGSKSAAGAAAEEKTADKSASVAGKEPSGTLTKQ